MAATSAAKKSSPAHLPIEDYDRLSIKQILPLLKSLSSRDLKAVTAHEKAGKNRVTLLRGIRKVELDREAAASKRPAKARLAVVEGPVAVEPVSEPAAAVAKATYVDEIDDIDRIDELDPIDEIDRIEFGRIDRADRADQIDDLDDVSDVADFDDVSDVDEVSDVAPAAAKVIPAKKRRSRPAVKAATWEEELRPQLPKRYQSSAFDDLDPPVIAVEESSPALIPTPAASSIAAKTAKVPSHRPRMTKRFESAALVMAAILAVLLGLAIGTVLARSGSSGASPAPTSVAIEAASVPAGG